MKNIRTLLFFLPLLLTSGAFAQVLQPAQITITSTFTNPAGAVKSRLENASGPGIGNAQAEGRTTEAVPRTATSNVPSSLTDTSATVPLTVDAAGSPQWQVFSTLSLSGNGELFYFGPSGIISTAPGGSYSHTFSSEVSIVDITFSAAVSRGYASVTSADGLRTLAQLTVPAGNRAEVVVPGGAPLRIQLAVETGTGGTAGSLRRVVRTINTWTGAGGVPANTIVPASLNISEPATLGSIKGVFDVMGEVELAATTSVEATYFSHNYPAYGTWQRTFAVPGDPASGAFTLGSLPSSASIAVNDPGAGSSYGVQATAFLKNTLPSGNKAVQLTRTKMLLGAEVPSVLGGGSAVLETELAITPGYLHGTIQLNGPGPEPGITPVLHGIVTSADADGNTDGVPDGGGSPDAWLNASLIISRTAVDSSSYGGTAQMILERTTAGAVTTCEYELICASPNSGPAVNWTPPGVRLLMANNNITEAQYFSTSYEMTRAGAAPLSLMPGDTHPYGYAVEMGEVILTVRSASPAVNIWQPQLQLGGLTDAPANAMRVHSIGAFGWPTTAAAAAQRASLRTVLPAGTYTLQPLVKTVSISGPGSTMLAPFTITVPPRGRVTADNGLTLSAGVPLCIPAGGAPVSGTVSSGAAAVTAITYRVDGGAVQNASFVPGISPSFSLTLPAGLANGPHTITLTVTSADGRTASVTHQFERDATPPVIAAPPDMTLESPIGGMIVHYPVPVASDNCGTITVICNPPSGSMFPLGTTTITCTAQDASGNTASDTFTITLVQPCPPPVRSHQYAGNADSHFRHPDKAGYHAAVPMTIQAWVKRSDAERCETIISQNYNTSFWFGFCPKLRFYRSGGTFADADTAVPEHQWTHVAVSYDGTNVSFYINGQAAGVKPLSHAGTGSAGPVTIGSDFTEGPSNYQFKGHLDEVVIHSRALSASEINTSMSRQLRLDDGGRVSTFGSGGRTEDLAGTTGTSGPAAPTAEIEGILPRYSVVPRTVNSVAIDGVINLATEYAGAEKMVIRYNAGPAVRDGLAHFVYRDEHGDRALYIGIRGLRDVVAPWTRAQSFVAVYFEPDGPLHGATFADATVSENHFRFCSRLDGTVGAGFTPSGFQRGNSLDNFGPLPLGDPLISAPAPFGIIGAGGDTMEFRFDLTTLGGDWQKAPRLSIAHHWIAGMPFDTNSPVGASFDLPFSWSDVFFAGQLPELQHFFASPQLTFNWLDPGCGFLLESSTNLLPTSWVPIAVPPVLDYRDGIFRAVSLSTDGVPRRFIRLRKP